MKTNLVVKLYRMIWQKKADLSEIKPNFDTIYVRITDFKSKEKGKYEDNHVPDYVEEAILQVRKWMSYELGIKRVILTSFQYDILTKVPEKEEKGEKIIEFGERMVWY